MAGEGLALLAPAYLRDHPAGSVKAVPLAEPAVRGDLLGIWQRGRTAGVLRTLLDALIDSAAKN